MIATPGDLPSVVVCSLEEARRDWRGFEAVITVQNGGVGDDYRMPTVSVPHLVLEFTDLDFIDDDPAAPRLEHMEQAIAFARRHAGKRLLIHCHKGRYRSPAVALAVLADIYGPGREADAVNALLAIRPVAAPNLIALILADAALARGGALHRAWLAHEATDRDIGRRRHGRYVIETNMPGRDLPETRAPGASLLRASAATPGDLAGKA